MNLQRNGFRLSMSFKETYDRPLTWNKTNIQSINPNLRQWLVESFKTDKLIK